jgi:Isochorismatase family
MSPLRRYMGTGRALCFRAAPVTTIWAARDDGQETYILTYIPTDILDRCSGQAAETEMAGGIGPSDVLIVVDVQNDFCPVRKGFRHEVDSYSAFYENDRITPTGLAGYLRERGLARVFLAGLAFDFCVRYSAEDARRLGFEAVVIADACRGIDLDGSVAATRASFAERGVVCVGAGEVGRS